MQISNIADSKKSPVIGSSEVLPVLKREGKYYFCNQSLGHIVFFRDQLGKRIKIKGIHIHHAIYRAAQVQNNNSRLVVIKKFIPASGTYPELVITPSVSHPNILRAELLVKGEDHYLLMPHFGVGTLADVQDILHEARHIKVRHYILQQIIAAVIYLAENNIQHNDLHSGNILIDEDAQIKIIDFGQASHLDPTKPIFGKFLNKGYPEELRISKQDSYNFSMTVLDKWAERFPKDELLVEIIRLMKTINLPKLKELNAKLKNLIQITQQEKEAFAAGLRKPEPCMIRSSL